MRTSSSAALRVVAEKCPHRVLKVGELAKDGAEHTAQGIGEALGRGNIDIVANPLERADQQGLDRRHGVTEHGEHLVVAHDGPSPGRLAQRLEDDAARHLPAGPRVVVELFQLGEVVDDRRAGPTNDGDAP